MTGSPIFSINFTNRNNPAKPNYHMSIKKSTAKCTEYRTAGHLVFWKPWPAVNLKKVLSVTKHGFVFWAQRKPNAKLEIYKVFQRKRGKQKEERRKRKEEVLSVTKHGFVFWAQRKPNARLEIYKAFQDRLTFLNRHMIVWFSWICSICEIYRKDRTAGHLVFWKPWPVTGHNNHSV